jgi:hypothetical protein
MLFVEMVGDGGGTYVASKYILFVKQDEKE